jgi:ATP phosphoribosyltransferase
MEHPHAELYEPVDLKIACCKLMTAGKPEQADKPGRLKIATKFVESTRQFYAQKGEQVEIIKLYGSMELAPLVGLADRIVDVVDTGNTLRANGLIPMEHIADISSRLIVNKASMKLKHKRIQQFIEQIREAVRERENG